MKKPSILGWVGANSAALFAVHLLLRLVGRNVSPTVLSGLSFAVAVGVTLLLQWVTLRSGWPHAGRFSFATFAGTIVGVPAGFVTFSLLETRNIFNESETTDVAAAMFLAGAVLGLCQWVVLRREANRAWLWIAASAVGFAAGGALCQWLWDLLSVLWSRNYLRGLDFPGYYQLVVLLTAFAAYGAATSLLWPLIKNNHREL